MGFFDRRPKASVAGFCQRFYDQSILAQIGPVDAHAALAESDLRSLVEADASFAGVDQGAFTLELAAVRFEVFSLAWLHNVKDKFAPSQTAFTKVYLHQRGRTDIWEAMLPYNKAIAQSATNGCDSSTPAGRGILTFVHSFRADIFITWQKQGYDLEAAGRATNRLCTDVAWKERVTAALVATVLSRAVGVDPNEAALLRATAIVIGFYNGAAEAIGQVRIQE